MAFVAEKTFSGYPVRLMDNVVLIQNTYPWTLIDSPVDSEQVVSQGQYSPGHENKQDQAYPQEIS